MLKEKKKTIIIATSSTLLIVLLALGIFLIRNNSKTTNNVDWIGFEKAKQISLDDIGNKENIKDISVELEKDDGEPFYKVKFKVEDTLYEYNINASTGEIVKQKENDHDFIEDTTNKENDKTNDASNKETNKDKYITKEKAKEIALNHAKVKNITDYKIKLDYENSVAVYEIEFKANGYEYDYDINAISGKILKEEKDKDDDDEHQDGNKNKNNGDTKKDNYIGEAKALDIAKNHAKVKNITNYKIKLDKDDNKVIYEIEFKSEGFEYDYDIDATNGKIIKSDKEKDDDIKISKPENNYIEKDKAKEIALNHAGVKDYTGFKIELDDGVYEIEFKSDGFEYEYDIDATSGKIIKNDKEIDD